MVRNLKQAVERYSNLPGVKFTEPTDSVLCIEAPAIRQSENIKVVAAHMGIRLGNPDGKTEAAGYRYRCADTPGVP